MSGISNPSTTPASTSASPCSILIYLPALRSRGLSIRLANGGMSFVVEPKDALSGNPQLLGRIRQFRDEILLELQAEGEIIRQFRLASLDNSEYRYDPRPDLSDDSFLWRQLLRLAEKHYPEVYSPLHGFRCRGSKITRYPSGWHMGFDARRAASEDDTGTWRDQAELDDAVREWLRPADDFVSQVESPVSKLLLMLGGD